MLDEVSELVRYLARSLVDYPDAVEVHASDGGRAILVELTVDPDDLGKVIGREGRTARAIRTLLSATTARRNRRAILEILE